MVALFYVLYGVKNSGGDPRVLINVFKVKTYCFTTPQVGVCDEDPTFGKQAAHGRKKLFMSETCPR